MHYKSYLILFLLSMVIAAPVVDAMVCDDCKDIVPIREMRQCSIQGEDHSKGSLQLFASNRPAQQETDTAPDLCPMCADSGAVIDAACGGVLSLISHTNHLPKLIAFSDPSYSITKPPQN